jgi:TM2 domain-containing membrane protein YozV
MVFDDERPSEVTGPEATKERSMTTTPADPHAAYPGLPLPTAGPLAAPAAAPPKSPILALVLSLFPGIGQIYNGQPAKALAFFFGWVGSIYLTAEANPFFAFLIAFTYLYNLVDAWRSASAINARYAGGYGVAEEDAAESPAWGAVLMGVGALLLLNNLGWLRLAAMQRYWPLVLIAAGGAFLYGSVQRARRDGGSNGGTR